MIGSTGGTSPRPRSVITPKDWQDSGTGLWEGAGKALGRKDVEEGKRRLVM